MPELPAAPAAGRPVPVMPAAAAGGGDATDGVAGRVLADLLAQAHLMAPGALTAVLAERACPLGVRGVRIYLADLQQRHLHPLPDNAAQSPAVLSIDSTLAGRAFQTVTIHRASTGAAGGGLVQLWVPLIDGTERLGVLELVVEDAGEAMLGRYRALASLAGLLIASKSVYSDTFARARRSREVALQAEMVWAFIAPTTFATEHVILSAVLEPAYEVGGDAFDYSLLGEHLHVSLFDAAGHDLAAGLIASVAMASSRTTRRSGGGLTDIAARADHAIAGQFGDSRFATALLCDLNIATGELAWIPCGHPPPLLIRDNKVIKELFRRPWPPLGLAETPRAPASDNGGLSPPVYTEHLEPRDRILLYTDGVVEGRARGSQFGLERLTDFIIRHSASGTPAPETLRRLNHAILDHQHGRLSDDATTVLIEWMPDNPGNQLTA
jgi:serine phosphatase RsbU (regulator of sigma subunit)